MIQKLVALGILKKKEADVIEDMLNIIKYEYGGRMHASHLKAFKERVAKKWHVTPRTVHNYFRKLRRLGIMGVETTATGDYYIISPEFGSKIWQLYKEYRSWLSE